MVLFPLLMVSGPKINWRYYILISNETTPWVHTRMSMSENVRIIPSNNTNDYWMVKTRENDVQSSQILKFSHVFPSFSDKTHTTLVALGSPVVRIRPWHQVWCQNAEPREEFLEGSPHRVACTTDTWLGRGPVGMMSWGSYGILVPPHWSITMVQDYRMVQGKYLIAVVDKKNLSSLTGRGRRHISGFQMGPKPRPNIQ